MENLSDNQVSSICLTIFSVCTVISIALAVIITNWVWYGRCPVCRTNKKGC